MFKKLTFLACVIFSLVFFGNYAFGVNDKQWFGGSSTAWMTASNWQGSTVPNGTNDTWIVKRTYEPTISTGTAVVEKLLIGPGWAGDKKPTLTMTAGTLNVDDYISIGYGGSTTKGTFVLSGGTVNADRGGNKMVLVGHGNYGDGLLWMTGGTINTSLLDIPANWSSGTNGDARVRGGTIYADTLRMKSGGYLNFTEGQLVLSGNDTSTVSSYINSGYIKAYHGVSKITNWYDSANSRTIVKANRGTVGAIYWGGWYYDNPWQDNLLPAAYHYRLPFYTTWPGQVVEADNQDTVDDEIAYASDHELDYFAHVYYHIPVSGSTLNYCMNYGLKYHLSSSDQDDLNFCLLLQGQHLGASADWDDTCDDLVDFMEESNYQTVCNGRPLIYMHAVDEFEDMWNNNTNNIKGALDDLRTAATTAGLGSPYIVCMVGHSQAGTGSSYVNNYGFNAISGYTKWDPGSAGASYSSLASANTTFWNACKNTGKKVVPIVNAGLDRRPRANVNWYAQPTMTQLKNHIKAALTWNVTNTTYSEANTVIIYAWNETDEGGWLHPDYNDNDERLDALENAVNGL